jgi:uncharacterized membrane protein
MDEMGTIREIERHTNFAFCNLWLFQTLFVVLPFILHRLNQIVFQMDIYLMIFLGLLLLWSFCVSISIADRADKEMEKLKKKYKEEVVEAETV